MDISVSQPSKSQPPPAAPAHRWEDWLAAFAMGLLALITFANVLARYLTDQSFAWTEEISTGLMVILTLAAAAAAVARDRHIRIEILFAAGSAQRRRLLALLSAGATAVAFAMLTGFGCRFAYDDFRYDVTSPGIGLPQWGFSIWLPLLGLAVTWRALQLFLKLWRQP
jgi:TRAP-type C4-dicarboxylate transport system permease small subunit